MTDKKVSKKLTAKSTKVKESKAKASKVAKPKKESKPKKLSALDAAEQVLALAAEPLNCKSIIEQMTHRGLWTSPGGKTPHATLYAAIIREIKNKGDRSRFIRVKDGKFTVVASFAEKT